ncbi:hypothetical protein G9P44_001070 [Scheffersomyces stipitis]|nr:hypothetical protein G9P44_001070 [Scheffersomyces stipitis]
MIRSPSNASLFILAPVFLIASDFIVTRFSQTGTKKIVKAPGARHASTSAASLKSQYNHNVYRSSWIRTHFSDESSPASKR